jgi:hypothetical protein
MVPKDRHIPNLGTYVFTAKGICRCDSVKVLDMERLSQFIWVSPM